jgi:hypothetical protein
VENVNQENASIFVQGSCHPDGEGDADRQIEQVSGYSDCHGQPPFS